MKSRSSKAKKANGQGKTRKIQQNSPENGLLIAAIGASAGGIEAFTELVSNLPAQTGMAYVLVQHLDPKHHSLLTERISKKTKMNVLEVADGMLVRPDHVYVIPPNTTMSISQLTLRLGPREESRGPHMSIDHFMQSLAEEQGQYAIGVILSGSGSDGTLGMAEIQAQGGVTFAQEASSAKYDGMPRSAIAAGCVDYILSPKEIAFELARVARHPYISPPPPAGLVRSTSSSNAGLTTIFHMLRRNVGLDFSHYRQTTILRRIQRRMVLHKIERLEDYIKYIQSNSAEIKALYQDMLINVTSFFRNPKAFDALKTEVFPNILRNHSPEETIRVWTPGCASGEETYSVAICLLEYLGDKASHTPIQFFGTDVSDANISKARSGFYSENTQADVSAERLRRFFSKIEGGYRISKSIRDMCIFAQHNLLSDPPFSQMDLICCRNLLIYLEPVLQNKVISLFHYGSRPGGYLLLGTSEGLGPATSLFSPVDRNNKIFLKKATAMRQSVSFSMKHPADRAESGSVRVLSKATETTWNYMEAQKEFDRRLLTQFSPATVFVNEDLEIIHSRGNVNRFLKLAPGRASLSILKMAREGLLLDLRHALGKAKKEGIPVHRQNIQIKYEESNGNGEGHEAGPDKRGGARRVRLDVFPVNVGDLKESYFMVVFQDEATETGRFREDKRARSRRESEDALKRIPKLEQELAATKEYLQSVIETQEATNEELQSANEEILSSNEELQSTNEELETAKEELQSVNEELTTVNDELRSRNAEVTQVNNDLTNLLASIDIAVVIVSSDLTIRRFTPEALKLLGLIPTDVGRPLININPTVEVPDFQAMVVQVMASCRPVERELQDRKGGQYQLRILPYRTIDNKIDGAVVTLLRVHPENAYSPGSEQAPVG